MGILSVVIPLMAILLVIILLMDILSVVIPLMAILLVVILLMAILSVVIGLVVILLMVIDGYFIGDYYIGYIDGYWWLFY